MKSKPLRLHEETNLLNGAYLLIKFKLKPDEPLKPSFMENKLSVFLITKFMNILNGTIGAKSIMNYHIEPVRLFTIRIPIHVHTNIDAKNDIADLVDERINRLKSFLESYDWSSSNRDTLWIIRSLETVGIPISTAFYLSTHIPNIQYDERKDDPIILIQPKVVYPTIVRDTFSDGSFITYVSDPYVKEYGQFMNLTKSFNDMGLSYNGLHLYEHLMTKAWTDSGCSDKQSPLTAQRSLANNSPLKDASKGLVELNGSTWQHAICYIYTINDSIESMKTYAVTGMRWYLQSRDPKFWDDPVHKASLNTEIDRTISETRTERSLTCMGRSDLHAYNYAYNTNIFTYYSNTPLEMLIVGPDTIDKLSLKHDPVEQLLAKHPIQTIQRPENISFKRIPLDVLKMKSIQGYKVLSSDTSTIKNGILNCDSDTKVAYGLDCTLAHPTENLGSTNIVLHPLLFLGKLFNESELNEFANTHVLPWTCRMYNSTALSLKDATFDDTIS